MLCPGLRKSGNSRAGGVEIVDATDAVGYPHPSMPTGTWTTTRESDGNWEASDSRPIVVSE